MTCVVLEGLEAREGKISRVLRAGFQPLPGTTILTPGTGYKKKTFQSWICWQVSIKDSKQCFPKGMLVRISSPKSYDHPRHFYVRAPKRKIEGSFSLKRLLVLNCGVQLIHSLYLILRNCKFQIFSLCYSATRLTVSTQHS